ncbi:hypothetical protein DITRI_Ditri12bG0066100 [Diplodiscus trichospermus]
MAASCGRTLQFSCASAKTVFTHSLSSRTANGKLGGLFSLKPTSESRSSLRNLISSRLPVELGGAVTLMPLHTATSSALFTSLLSLHNQSWGCLSEGNLLTVLFYVLPWHIVVFSLFANLFTSFSSGCQLRKKDSQTIFRALISFKRWKDTLMISSLVLEKPFPVVMPICPEYKCGIPFLYSNQSLTQNEQACVGF